MQQLRPNASPSSRPRSRIPGWAFSNSYARLPERFFARLDPGAVADPRLIKVNTALAAALGLPLGGLDDSSLAAIFSGNLIPEGAEPLAIAYAGHQFGQFVPRLGDGRAILLGEVIDTGGVRRDLQLKGSGRTPFSRGGDGRAALGPVLREYLVSEAMHALGIPTTRSLAAVSTGEIVYRETRLPGAIVTRVASSHVRVGSFEYFAAQGDVEALARLADYVIERHYPELRAADRPYLELLRAVIGRQAALVARWMQVGFIHGVMNTDNTSVCGETIDFGPCAFMDTYDPATVFSSIDARGRYAYDNQPPAARWNLARFAEALLPLIDTDPARAVEAAGPLVDEFQPQFEAHWLARLREKLGLAGVEDGDLELVQRWLALLQSSECDFTRIFRQLTEALEDGTAAQRPRAAFRATEEFDRWHSDWRMRLERGARADLAGPAASVPARALMRRANPVYIPRNHRIEAVIQAAVERADFAPFEEMLEVLSQPFEEQPGKDLYALPPLPAERVMQTFCGT